MYIYGCCAPFQVAQLSEAVQTAVEVVEREEGEVAAGVLGVDIKTEMIELQRRDHQMARYVCIYDNPIANS